ncbi:MAG: hypothetical protein VX589_06960 [Myxococcota bacterium]|nr:hypothetical protein [Myxococcota bacterium]
MQSSHPKHRANLFIALFVVVQLALPLSYYLGNNPFDERFAWRMFSPVRLASCTVQAFEVSNGQRRTIRLSKEIHQVWINLLRRARPDVIREVSRFLCEARSDTEKADVRLSIQCIRPDAVTKPVCTAPRDQNRDGVPDSYERSVHCDGLTALECFRRDCPSESVETCRAKRCEMWIKKPEDPVCGVPDE